MSNSHRSFGYGDEMMQHMFDMDAGYKPTSSATMQRKNKMKRMEELSHSLDDGLNNLSDDYDRERSGGVKNRGRAARPQQYDDEIDDDDDGETEDRYIDDYYYSGTTKSYDQRPRSYNEKYASYNMHDDYDSRGENYNRNRYSLNESLMSKGRHQQSPLAQQRQMQPTLRRPPTAGPSSSGTAQANSKHILFNDEDDVRYVNEKKQMNKSASYSFSPTPKHKKEPSSPTSLFSKKKPSKEDLAKIEKPGQQVMKAKLKIQNLSNDDTILHMKNSKQSQLTRFHSLEAKLPSHGSERNAMSPTILEEIEFEMQDVDNEKEFEKEHGKEILEKEKEKPSKDKSGKDKKRDNSASAPTAKKSLKAHLSNHKKLFKVPDIDLNNLKFSCFFSSNKNITALNSSKQKKEEPISKSVDALNDSPKSSQTSKSPPSSPSHKTKVETKFEKHEKINKVDKFEERQERCVTNRTKSNRTMGSGSTIQSSSEGFKDDENSGNSLSDIDFESQAMKVVRTVGQAFEVCHKISSQKKQENNDDNSENMSDLDQSDIQNLSDFDEPKKALDTTPVLQDPPQKLQRPNQLENLSTPLNNLMAPSSPNRVNTPLDDNKENSRDIQMMKEQLQHQTQQTKQALAQLILVREQLLTETNARIEAQARTQQLLQQNRELLEHIASLSGMNDSDRPGLSPTNIGMAPQMTSTAKVARWFSQLQSYPPASLSRPESGFVSTSESRSEKNLKKSEGDEHYGKNLFSASCNNNDDYADEYLLVEGTASLWSKLSVKKRKKLLGLKLGKVTTF